MMLPCTKILKSIVYGTKKPINLGRIYAYFQHQTQRYLIMKLSFDILTNIDIYNIRKSYQLFVTGVITLSMLATFSTAEANLRDIENNDHKANQSGALHEGNQIVNAQGELNTSDKTDTYSILDQGTLSRRITWSIRGRGTVLQVFIDTNKNGRYDPSDYFLFFINNGKSKSIRTSKGKMYLAIATKMSANKADYIISVTSFGESEHGGYGVGFNVKNDIHNFSGYEQGIRIESSAVFNDFQSTYMFWSKSNDFF